jgi:hypothetical protein
VDCAWFLRRIGQRNGLVEEFGGCGDVAARDLGSKEVSGSSSMLTLIVAMKVVRRVAGVDPTSSPSNLSQNDVFPLPVAGRGPGLGAAARLCFLD